jgi:hypothetical protein
VAYVDRRKECMCCVYQVFLERSLSVRIIVTLGYEKPLICDGQHIDNLPVDFYRCLSTKHSNLMTTFSNKVTRIIRKDALIQLGFHSTPICMCKIHEHA